MKLCPIRQQNLRPIALSINYLGLDAFPLRTSDSTLGQESKQYGAKCKAAAAERSG